MTVIGGGSRSGKSRFALELARKRGAHLALIATAEALDQEMRERIAAHQADRGNQFTTIEEPLEVSGVLGWQSSRCNAIVVDCLTIWLGNLMRANRNVEMETERLLTAAANSPADVLLVTNEVGCGIVPDNELARRFRDESGRLNQRAAEAADEVFWMAFGCPLKVK